MDDLWIDEWVDDVTTLAQHEATAQALNTLYPDLADEYRMVTGLRIKGDEDADD